MPISESALFVRGGERSCKMRLESGEPLLQKSIIARTEGSAAECTYA